MRNFTLLDLSNNNINSVDLYETSNLGLNSKVKKKFDNIDAIDNIGGFLSLEECYDYVDRILGNTPNVRIEKEKSLTAPSFIDYTKSEFFIKIIVYSDKYASGTFETYIGYVLDGNGHICIFCRNSYIEENILLPRFKKYLCNKNWKESSRHIIFCSPDAEGLPLDILEFTINYIKENCLT